MTTKRPNTTEFHEIIIITMQIYVELQKIYTVIDIIG